MLASDRKRSLERKTELAGSLLHRRPPPTTVLPRPGPPPACPALPGLFLETLLPVALRAWPALPLARSSPLVSTCRQPLSLPGCPLQCSPRGSPLLSPFSQRICPLWMPQQPLPCREGQMGISTCQAARKRGAGWVPQKGAQSGQPRGPLAGTMSSEGRMLCPHSHEDPGWTGPIWLTEHVQLSASRLS